MSNNILKTHDLRPRPTHRTSVRLAVLFAALPGLAAALGSFEPLAVEKNPATQQLEFGVKVALKGSWNEAAFRFQRAIKLGAEEPRVYNNLAVAQESLGQYDQARASYEKALSLEKQGSEEPKIRENYERLVNFLKQNRPAPAAP